jgi:phosphate transport system permease protein
MNTSDTTRTANDADARRGAATRPARRSVMLTDKLAGWVITVGGLAGDRWRSWASWCFWYRVAVPLAGGERGPTRYQRAHRIELSKPNMVAEWRRVPDYGGLRVEAERRGSVYFISAPDAMISSANLDFGEQLATAVGGTLDREQLAFGFEDGSGAFRHGRFRHQRDHRRDPAEALLEP